MSKLILVNSHSRSGTHFLIDTLTSNIKDAVFPNSLYIPRDFNISTLVEEKTEAVYNSFQKNINNNKQRVIVIKNHLLPEELNLISPQDKYEEFLKEIYHKSVKIYIYRDGKDVLTSWYKYFEDKNISFGDFIREKNDYISPLRKLSGIDENRVKYWNYHVESWLEEEGVIAVKYEDLHNDYEKTVSKLLDNLGEKVPKTIKRPGVPKNILLHRIMIRLNKMGLIKKLKSTSVKPGKGSIGRYRNYFTEDDIKFFEENTKKA